MTQVIFWKKIIIFGFNVSPTSFFTLVRSEGSHRYPWLSNSLKTRGLVSVGTFECWQTHIGLYTIDESSFQIALLFTFSKICWSFLPAPTKKLLRLFMDGLQVDFSLFFGAFTSESDMCVIERDLDEWTDFFWNWLFNRPHTAKTNVTKLWNHFQPI